MFSNVALNIIFIHRRFAVKKIIHRRFINFIIIIINIFIKYK